MNKLRHIFIIAFLAITAYAIAQVGEHRNDFSVGFMGGYTMNSMDFMNPSIKQSKKGSPMFGFAARYICEKYFTAICGVEMELQYTNLGWKEVIEDGTENQYTRNLNYVQVPMLMQMGWGRERRGLKFIFEAGPQFGFYLNGSEKKVGNPWDPSHRPNGVNYQYGKEPDNKFDYGIAAGAGVEVSTPVGHFLLQGRYYYGLSDVFDNSKKGDFGRSANQTLLVKMTYLFDLVRTKGDNIK